ncbi:helicase [Mycobacterium intermedium]|uniref:Helicase n=1 Tax=Mycobacterium intermedium TaxID=28445 RepID=A0A1E3SAC7_MYCIE|nr:helicase-related protein [Mycobacterium intermedium]MCV6967751.1 DEAD/DEAH box helicase family protein [Mycobacterium intermedium]ODQ99135.1 helicase [Mycobacterium intermedium]OPE50559.1 helicase [Mycobacterium intermedium]ORB05504.1 helicase [Mycobacterium intermedium]
MIEKKLTHQLLESGELVLTAAECTALGLPEHSTTITIELEGEHFGVQWSGRSRKLCGDQLTERLQDYGQVGGLLLLRRVDESYRLQLLPPGATIHIQRPLIQRPPLPKTPAGQKAARRRATVDRQFHADTEYDWSLSPGNRRTVGFLTEASKILGEQLKAAGFDELELVELRLQGEELATLDNFEELLAVDVANVDRMPHQEAVARHALSRLRGRAVLADEVGLGKTIEAGLAVKELTLRGLARRVLVLCPAPLRDQWREEMDHKFDLPFEVAYRGHEIQKQDKLILSLQLATSNIDKLTARPWDIVILDEAHRAAGSGARKRRELITALTTACRYAFFLTATPVQNDLLELYRLIELLRPGTFTSVSAFKSQYMSSGDPRRPNDPAALRRLISSAMIRTTRAQAGVDRVVRRPVDVPIDLGPRERELYALCTDLLRNVMRDSGDTMRRRSLALRLTASPFSMGTTALRMAERHSNERVRKALNEIGHLAMDIQGSARENAALQITRDWIREHGRVLIFTQHTDTVTGLLRRISAEGLRATAFHGSMSAGERAATIAAFKSGEAPIMISTDAGAEGQNLQFCNCVLNYDLPWNPMRIEQRIGRVDRLTQPRDEVFVANLYARSTVDESVYRLLAEKLRMFELLFGQVTTILGELDDSKSATFESRVLEALFAPDDTRMQSLLSQLGTELVDARKRASTLIAADSGLSSWMASAAEHRKGLTKAGSNELAPEVAERARIRQRKVQAWVRRVLKALDAQLIHDTGDGEGAFLTVQFDEELAEELGGRTLLHIAFDRLGMEHHPDAELCAVGSPVFDELLGLLRVRGDMHATVPVIPEDPGPTPFRHAQSTTLARRRLIPSGTWSGNATFRATVGEAETTEHIITAELGAHNEIRLPRRPLQDGECLPSAFGDPSEIVAAFQRAATEQLEQRRQERTEQILRERKIELDRIRKGYNAQIAEASYEDKTRLRRALASEEQRLGRAPDVRARAKMLAVILDEDDWLVEEVWTGPGGSEGTLTYEWGLTEPPLVESDASGEPITVLALCSDAHWIDETEATHCDSCGYDRCTACGEDAIFTNCPLCDSSVCGSCRAETGGLCLRCNWPNRAPERDTSFAIAWRLHDDTTLLVGQRFAELVRTDGSSRQLIVRDEDVDDQHRVRLRSYALRNELPPDSGLVFHDHTERTVSPNQDTLLLRSLSTVAVELGVEHGAGSALDCDAIDDIPDYDAPTVSGEGALKLTALLEKLRAEVAPPAPPAVVVTRRSTFTDICLEADRLIGRVSVVGDDDMLQILDESVAQLNWRDHSPEDEVLAATRFAGLQISVERRHDAVVVRAQDEAQGDFSEQWIALPDGASVNEQFAWFEILRSCGTPGGRVGQRQHEPQAIAEPFPTPSECQLVDRTIKPVSEITPANDQLDLVPAQPESLATLGVGQHLPRGPVVNAMPTELGRALLARIQPMFTAVVQNGFEVHETWHGHGTATHTYRMFDGHPVAPMLDDIAERQSDFGVCRDGHFYAAGASALCESCKTWACPACDGIGNRASVSCSHCSASVCRRCASVEHAVPDVRCILCNDAACPGCGRDPDVQPCRVCEREMCAGCRVDLLCPACDKLALATDEQLHDLPTELAVQGATVFVGFDTNATTVLINRGNAIEQAIVRNGNVERWVVLGKYTIDDAYKLQLAASRHLGVQVKPVVKTLDPEAPIDVPHLLVQSQRYVYASWSVDEIDLHGRHTRWFTSPEGDITRLIAEDFEPIANPPKAIEGIPRKVRKLKRRAQSPQVFDLVLQWNRVGHDVAVTDYGLIDRTLTEAGVSENVVAWETSDKDLSWVAEAWNPSPRLRGYATTDLAEAAIVSIATLFALGVRSNDSVKWYVVSDSPQAPLATTLARSLGLEDADEVDDFVDPKAVRLSTVLNATSVSVDLHPIGITKSAARHSLQDTTAKALRAWMPTAQVRVPELWTLPPKLRTLLEQRTKKSEPRRSLTIGVRVEQLVSVEGGRPWRHEARLMPGDTDGRQVSYTTQVPLDSGMIDREGHFGPEGGQCPYCHARVCDACVDGLVGCDCCSVAICKQCVRQERQALWLCPACSAMRPPTRREARQHGRILLTRGMLIGVDQLHEVVVERAKKQWARQAEGGLKAPLLNSSLIEFLNERLEGTPD